MPSRQQLALAEATSPLHFEVSDLTNSDSLQIKGFVSVEIEDRQGQVVLAESFETDKYFVSPIILVNHKYWKDDNGNPIPVGSAKSLHITTIEPHPEDDTLVYVKDVQSGQIISDFPKAKVPRAVSGTKGFFAFVDITHPDIIDMIQKGQFGAFSWKGPVHVTYRWNHEKGVVEEVIDKVDLWEISVVGTPANYAAGFVVGKSVYALRFDKATHKTKGDVLKFLADHDLDFSNVTEDAKNFYCHQMDTMLAKKSLNDFTVVDAGAGISAIAGVPKDSWLESFLLEDSPTTQQKTPPEETMTEQVTTTETTKETPDFDSFLTKMDEKFQLTMKGAVEALSTQVMGIKESLKTELSSEIVALKSAFEELKTNYEAKIQGETSKEDTAEKGMKELVDLVNQAVTSANAALELANQSSELAQTVAKSVPSKPQTELARKGAEKEPEQPLSERERVLELTAPWFEGFDANIVA